MNEIKFTVVDYHNQAIITDFLYKLYCRLGPPRLAGRDRQRADSGDEEDLPNKVKNLQPEKPS